MAVLAVVDTEAWAFNLLKDLGGISVWAYDAGTVWPYRVETASLQIDVRASSKQRARDRAYEARGRLFDPANHWHLGDVIAGVEVVAGPFWLPDDNGAPRYVLRVSVRSHPSGAGIT